LSSRSAQTLETQGAVEVTAAESILLVFSVHVDVFRYLAGVRKGNDGIRSRSRCRA
jgi:hypothetical protein